jgi:hypothetical protein
MALAKKHYLDQLAKAPYACLGDKAKSSEVVPLGLRASMKAAKGIVLGKV